MIKTVIMQHLEIVGWSYYIQSIELLKMKEFLLYDYPMLMGGQEFMTYGLVILKNYNIYKCYSN